MYKIVCFIGHREIDITADLKKKITEYVEYLIVYKNVRIFLFGSRSQFDDLCYYLVSELKEKYTDIKRVYVRSCYEKLSEFYENYLLENYEETIYPLECVNAGKVSYIKRNQAMINKSDYCIFYYKKDYLPPKKKWAKRALFYYQPKSGTALSYKYAEQKQKQIKNFYQK